MEVIPTKVDRESEQVTLKDLFIKIENWYNYLLSKWLLILMFAAFGGVLGYAYAASQEDHYIAVTTFVLEEGDKGGGLGQYAGIASMVGVDLGGGASGIFQGDNIIELYKSRKMIEKTLLTPVNYNGKKQLLIDNYIAINKLRGTWAKKAYLNNITFSAYINNQKPDLTRVQDSVIGAIVNAINKSYLFVSKPDKKLSIIAAKVESEDEFFSKEFNQQIVKNVNDFYVQTKTKKSLENVLIMQQKTDSVRAVMNSAIYRAAAVVDATPNLNVTRQIQRTAPMQRSQVNAETNKAILSELVKNLELSKISLRKETPLIQVVDEPVYPLLVNHASKLKYGVIGLILFGFLACLFFSIKAFIKAALSE